MAIARLSASRKELRKTGPPRTFRGPQLAQIAFPLGGIGTGCVSLAGNGSLRDWEIFNRPAKGQQLPGSFFALWVRPSGEPGSRLRPECRVLKGPGLSSLIGSGHGGDRAAGGGLAHFRHCSFTGRMPFATVQLDEPGFPVKVTLEAFNPLIPGNDLDSSIPAAIFLYTLRNVAGRPLRIALNANLRNAVGTPEVGENVTAFAAEPGLRGLRMTSQQHPADSPRFGSMALATPWRNVTYLTTWPEGFGLDGLNQFWEAFKAAGRLADVNDLSPSAPGETGIGALALHANLKPGQLVTLPVVIAWHFPNYQQPGGDGGQATWRNYYATVWEDAWEVARYASKHLRRLEKESRAFQDALFGSSLPAAALDAIASQISILKTTTCLRLTDGTFWGFEGCHDSAGCCPGTCTHVWNYAQALAYLFPALERGAREAHYRYDPADDGHMTFRTPLPLGTRADRSYHAAADGQHGTIMRAYRDWLISGDEDCLKRIWPAMKRAMAYTWRHWDADQDGVMDGVQHNTYDIEFWGPNSMLGSYYLGALRAMEEIAVRFGERDQAADYRRLFESGRAWVDRHLFNGEYYEQQVNRDAPRDPASPASPVAADGEPKYQYGRGCLSDQVIGQWYATMLGLGHLLDPTHVKRALAAIFSHNWREEFISHDNPQRIYAADDERGLILCSWPLGGRPADPFFYSDEVWTGVEYQVASHLIYEGLVDEGLAMVKGARDRHDGGRRNPWDEIECGHHYARAMASYALLLALSGFHYSAPDQRIRFQPRLHGEDFTCFWCVGSGWGTYRQRLGTRRAAAAITTTRGSLRLRRVELPGVLRRARRVTAALGRRAAPVKAWDQEAVEFARPVTIRSGATLTITAL